ncbi:MAG: hypothetical protein CGU28_06880 [Candidatus Dactylopiibacterium carminicum]|uniref:Pilus assembly protein FimV n=1 Tax=Candidatus Dactylopiibacterium carminicum TaxID=857335 RepID=A0A272EX29_9RHOO|nr:hypothetical protein [Candidatus Dactylopiibacterium carminicum]KAF7600270.1 hypothetical protein BGI27_03350 [Candidatus Dactylopiibacterium carminicum]PAS94677.1 MAG: hypothetical protein CGU29_02965 [Candidatus Dactylopiibacterium carminicum]PAS96965.1 MAG: hypothetical protein CGU28_06880 [Candidatus Dactylopiibacterium carminicum]PAT00269.1 MAG: hypothetical protein BSR46_03370 [Candidatus Dactylopiibacterium carminicum]
MKILSCLALCLGMLCSLPLAAQTLSLRTIPADAPRAEMRPVSERQIKLNTRVFALSAGAQIRSALNTLVLTSQLGSGPFIVRVQFNQQGQVHRVWILTEAEQKVNAPRLSDDSIWRQLFPWLYDDTASSPAGSSSSSSSASSSAN